jgi:hypothetical protein
MSKKDEIAALRREIAALRDELKNHHCCGHHHTYWMPNATYWPLTYNTSTTALTGATITYS